MKEISIRIDDELYRRASQKVSDLDSEVNQRVTEYLQAMNDDEDAVIAARARMVKLFAQTKNFTVGVSPTREEMHDH